MGEFHAWRLRRGRIGHIFLGLRPPGSGFDANGNLRFLRYEKDGVLIRRFEYTYDDSNNRQSMLDVTPSKAVLCEYGFDWLDRLVTVKRAEAANVGSLPASPLNSTYLQREYVFDESDNRVFFDDHVNGLTYHYTYDAADQVEEVLIYPTAAGHRTIEDFTSFEAFVHDADGNMTKRTIADTSEEISYEWTDQDRLKSVKSDQNGRMQEAGYDIDGLRHRKSDKDGQVTEEYGVGISTAASAPGTSGSTAPSISYIAGHMILGCEIDGEFRYHLSDALSTVRDVVDDDGTVIKSLEFDEYGNLLSSSGTGAVGPKTFVGGLSVNDDTADSEMFNMGHRSYSAGVLGRFISRDPIGFRGSSLNLYAYPANPVRFTDPSGLDPGTITSTQITGSFRNDVIWAINKIRSLGYTERADLLESQLLSGELQTYPPNSNFVGFTNPLTGNISIVKEHCQSGATADDDFVLLASLLFHEATHASEQSGLETAAYGWEAYFMKNKRSECALELGAYRSEYEFLKKWLQNEKNTGLQTAIQKHIPDVRARVQDHMQWL